MQKSKLINTLKNIPQKEYKTILKYLQSDLVKDNKDLNKQKKLFKHLIKFYPNFNNNKLSKETVYQIVYSEQYSSDAINRLNGRLLTNIKYYINNLGLTKYNNAITALNEAQLYLNNGDEKLFDQTVSKLKLENEKKKPYPGYFLNAYLIENELLNFNYLYNTRKGELNTVKVSEKLDNFYIRKKLELILSALAQNKFAITNDISSLIKDYRYIKKYITQQKFEELEVLEIYCQSIEMIQNNDEDAYTKLKNLLSQKNDALSPDEKKNFHTLIRNFCSSEYSKGNENYLKELFDCYTNDLENKYLYHKGGILKSTMQAIVKIGLRLNKNNWVKDFLNNHRNKIIDTKEPERIFNYNMAEYYFHENEYEKCIDNLDDNLEDIHYKTSAKRLVIKALFETKSVLLESRINAFKIFIFRISDNKFTPIHKTGNNNFIDILKQICNPGTLSNKKRITSIQSKIIKSKAIADRQWLLDKLKEA